MNRNTALVLGAAIVVLAVVLFLIFTGGEPEPEPTPSPTASEEPSPSASPSPSFNAELLDNRLTVLLVGLDLNEERQGAVANTDALMLASISADQSSVVLVSLPRDTVDIPLADGGTYRSKINALFSERGIEELVDAMETLFGVPIDGHVTIDMDDFAALVEAVDGVTVNPAEPLSDPPIGLDVQPGEQLLDGLTALSYVRSRIDQDYGRMARQQEVILDLVARLADPDGDVDLGDLLDGLDSLETDLPLGELRTLIEIARRAQDAEVERVLVEPPEMIVAEGDQGDGRGYILVPDPDAILAAVTALIPPDE
ncbi:MAG: LCP family protein [Candidatus Limnocylindria bacterium]